jgi:hypothetical protein
MTAALLLALQYKGLAGAVLVLRDQLEQQAVAVQVVQGSCHL